MANEEIPRETLVEMLAETLRNPRVDTRKLVLRTAKEQGLNRIALHFAFEAADRDPGMLLEARKLAGK